MRSSTADELVRPVPARLLSLVQGLEFAGDDECVEVTPKKRAAPEGGALRTAAPDHDVAEEARACGYLVRRPTIGRNQVTVHVGSLAPANHSVKCVHECGSFFGGVNRQVDHSANTRARDLHSFWFRCGWLS